MGDFIKKVGGVIPVSIAGAIWALLVAVFTNYEKASFMFWGGFAFGLFSFICTCIVLYLTSNKTNSSLYEHNLLIYRATAIYLSASFLLNTVFVCIATSNNKKVTIIPNIVIILVYVGYMAIVLGDTARISVIGNKIDKKTIETKLIAANVSSLLAMTDDADVLSELSKLKDAVTYSDQIGCDSTKQIEEQFSNAITEIEAMLQSNDAKEEVLKKIKYVAALWNKRNTVLSVLK